jgi:hypothetical protein
MQKIRERARRGYENGTPSPGEARLCVRMRLPERRRNAGCGGSRGRDGPRSRAALSALTAAEYQSRSSAGCVTILTERVAKGVFGEPRWVDSWLALMADGRVDNALYFICPSWVLIIPILMYALGSKMADYVGARLFSTTRHCSHKPPCARRPHRSCRYGTPGAPRRYADIPHSSTGFLFMSQMVNSHAKAFLSVAEIRLTPDTSTHKIGLKLLVDGQEAHRLQTTEKRRLLV